MSEQHSSSSNVAAEKLPPGVHPPLPEDKFSMGYCVALWDQLKHVDLHDPAEVEWIIEALRRAGELACWGDKNDHDMADFLIMESEIVGFIVDIMDTAASPATRVAPGIYVQCIQTVVIMLQNHSRESTLFFILSNGKFNRVIEARLDYSNEDIVSIYVSFLKSLTSRLTSKSILPLFCNGGAFPLLSAAMNSALLTHDDRMVRTSVRQVIGQMLRINDPAVKQFAQGCVPRLVDDLGAFLEAQLRNLSLLVDDESVSMVAVEMNDEDIADEGLYLIDLLSGCSDDHERMRMARIVRDYVLERLLLHAQDSDGADVIVSTVVFMFLSRWLGQAPKWFLECVFSTQSTDNVVTSMNAFQKMQQELEQQQSKERVDEKQQQQQQQQPGSSAPKAHDAAAAAASSPGSSHVSATPILTQSLSWALFATPSLHSGLTPVRQGAGATAAAAVNSPYNSRSHPPASTVTRSAICVLGTVFEKLTDGKLYEWRKQEKKSDDGTGGAAGPRTTTTLSSLVQLLCDALVGMSERVDRTSTYNCAALFYLARQILSGDSTSSNDNSKNNNDDDENDSSSTNDSMKRVLRDFFDRLVMDSELLSNDQSPLRLELLLVVDSMAKQGNAPLFTEKALNICKAREPWPGFIDELRFPLKRPLKFREPMSQQERVTHRACVLAYLRGELLKGRTALCDTLAKKLLKEAALSAGAVDSRGATKKVPVVAGNLVNEDLSPEGGLPSVFLTIEGNVLRILRVEFGAHGAFLHNNSSAKQPAGASRQLLPIVALSLTQDVSRPFVLHFCSPLCCGVAPFSVSFPSRQIAAQVLKVLSDAASKLREKLLTDMTAELRQR